MARKRAARLAGLFSDSPREALHAILRHHGADADSEATQAADGPHQKAAAVPPHSSGSISPKPHARVIVNQHVRELPAGAVDGVAPIAGLSSLLLDDSASGRRDRDD